jgi:hypothetical protein
METTVGQDFGHPLLGAWLSRRSPLAQLSGFRAVGTLGDSLGQAELRGGLSEHSAPLTAERGILTDLARRRRRREGLADSFNELAWYAVGQVAKLGVTTGISVVSR